MVSRRAEVAVVGVGTVGSMAVWQLAQRGVSVVGFERHNIGHPMGGAGGDTRLYRVSTESPPYVPMTVAALPLWQELQEASGLPILELTGALYAGPQDSAYIANVRHNVTTLGLAHEELDLAAVASRFPKIPLAAGDAAIFEPNAGFVRSGHAIVGAVAVARELGATVLEHCEVSSIRPEAAGIRITAGGEDWLVDKVVYTTGAWANDLLPRLLPHLEVRVGNVHWYPLRTGAGYRAHEYPIIEIEREPYGFGAWPSEDGMLIKVGLFATLKRVPTPAHFDGQIPDEVMRLIDSYVEQFIPDAIPNCVRHATGFDALASDGDFILGPHPADERIVLGVGMAMRGFKMAPTVGAALADWATTGTTQLPVQGFGADRFRPLPNLV